MTVTCWCSDSTHKKGDLYLGTKKDENDCVTACVAAGYDQAHSVPTGLLFGISATIIIAMIVVSILVLVLMIWFSIHVMNKCKGRPKWLNPTIITLLVLWLLMGWFPPIGLLFFIILLVILIMYNGKCKKR